MREPVRGGTSSGNVRVVITGEDDFVISSVDLLGPWILFCVN